MPGCYVECYLALPGDSSVVWCYLGVPWFKILGFFCCDPKILAFLKLKLLKRLIFTWRCYLVPRLSLLPGCLACPTLTNIYRAGCDCAIAFLAPPQARPRKCAFGMQHCDLRNKWETVRKSVAKMIVIVLEVQLVITCIQYALTLTQTQVLDTIIVNL